jgi:hypothetical protein
MSVTPRDMPGQTFNDIFDFNGPMAASVGGPMSQDTFNSIFDAGGLSGAGDYLGSYGDTNLLGSGQPASAGFFDAVFDPSTAPGPYDFADGGGLGDYAITPQPGMGFGLERPASAGFFNGRLAEPNLYDPIDLDTAMSGSRTTPMAGPARLGSEIAPEFTPHVPDWARSMLDKMPSYDDLTTPAPTVPMGGYTPPAPPQDYTAPPSLLAGMNIGGAVADRLNTPPSYTPPATPASWEDNAPRYQDRVPSFPNADAYPTSTARTPSPTDAMRSGLERLGSQFGVSAAAAPPAAPATPRFEPPPVQQFTERVRYETKMVPEKVKEILDVPAPSFSKANVSKSVPLGSFGMFGGIVPERPFSTDKPVPGLTTPKQQAQQREQTRMVPQRTRVVDRVPVPPSPRPAAPPVAAPKSFASVPTARPSFEETFGGWTGFTPGIGGAFAMDFGNPIAASFSAAGNSLFGGLSDSVLSGLGYGPDSSFTGGWGMGWGDGGPGGYGGGSAYDSNSGPYGGGDARFDGGWGGVSDGDTYR